MKNKESFVIRLFKNNVIKLNDERLESTDLIIGDYKEIIEDYKNLYNKSTDRELKLIESIERIRHEPEPKQTTPR